MTHPAAAPDDDPARRYLPPAQKPPPPAPEAGFVAPGWYPDPDDPDRMRWWDGRAWTDRRQRYPRAPESYGGMLARRWAIALVVVPLVLWIAYQFATNLY
jgi:hypothetical protein